MSAADPTRERRPPVVWSIAGHDSGGGAGLAADQRAADAFGVHLCPVVAALTAQNSQAVQRVEPLPVAWLDAQLQALADDMPPAVVKTGLLGGAEQVRCVARWIDRLRERGRVDLVVDPVLAASSGAAFADDATIRAYRDALLPRATALTPNRREAGRLLGDAADADADADAQPARARRLRALGAGLVVVTGGDSAGLDGRVTDWLTGPLAEGWLAGPRIDTPHGHGTGCTFATALAAALALGHPAADATVLAKLATSNALRHARAAGAGAGPVIATAGFHADAASMPLLSWDPTPRFEPPRAAAPARRLDLYAIVDSAERLCSVLDAGVRSVQLRIKAPDHSPTLRNAIARSAEACRAAGAELFVNDHWQLAIELRAGGVHLGQEDIGALGERGRDALRRSGLALGISSHSLWELCRARALAPRYIACGPVWPTLTKSMPWQPQGLDNLRWWRAMAGAPVVAIGGLLDASRAEQAAGCGVDGVCIVRGLGDAPAAVLPDFDAALRRGRATAGDDDAALAMPHPCLAPPERAA